MAAMKAMILAAGRGSRMGALTDDTPKPLVKVAGKAMMLYVIEALKAIGVNSLVVNTCYQASRLEEFFLAHDNFGIDLAVSHENDLLDTGGGVLHARHLLQDVDLFVLHNADVYSEIDLQALLATHRSAHALATLAIQKRSTTRHLLFSQDMSLAGWENTSQNVRSVLPEFQGASLNPYGFCGVHVLSREIFDHFAQLGQQCFSIIAAYLKIAEESGKIVAYDIGKTPWFDIGTPEKLAKVESYLSQESKVR